ncbi:hypothetical protein GCM10023238_05990 [Streptomyces heliomycini]
MDRPELVDPDTWTSDYRDISRPGNDLAQLSLFRDYATNPPLYPRLHEYFRENRVPLLAIWGAEDLIFGPDGARAFARDLPDAEIHLVSGGGHFLLESHLETAGRPHPGLPDSFVVASSGMTTRVRVGIRSRGGADTGVGLLRSLYRTRNGSQGVIAVAVNEKVVRCRAGYIAALPVSCNSRTSVTRGSCRETTRIRRPPYPAGPHPCRPTTGSGAHSHVPRSVRDTDADHSTHCKGTGRRRQRRGGFESPMLRAGQQGRRCDGQAPVASDSPCSK